MPRDPQALAKELFAELDAAKANHLGGTLPRATVINIAAAFIRDHCFPKKKSVTYADMSDQEFLEYLVQTYTWLDVERELVKCQAWTKAKIKGSKGPTRMRIINWMNRAEGKPVDTRRNEPGQSQLPIPEPEKWREVIKAEFSENSLWYRYVEENVQWSKISRTTQIEIATYMEKRGL